MGGARARLVRLAYALPRAASMNQTPYNGTAYIVDDTDPGIVYRFRLVVSRIFNRFRLSLSSICFSVPSSPIILRSLRGTYTSYRRCSRSGFFVLSPLRSWWWVVPS